MCLKQLLPLCFAFTCPALTAQNILHVGPGQTYPNLSAAVNAVEPGDTIQIHAGTYSGGLFFGDLQGQPDAWISIRNAPGETAVFQGGGNAIQLSDPAYLHISGLIFQQQTGNGFNTDDGGSYDTPAHHIIFENCTFRDMAATGNNDLLKLSGLDDFQIVRCTIQNGAAGGSGIDMVGCHHGLIQACYFENLGSNAIQAKGGCEDIQIERNFFRDGGQRTLNLGGSTGLAFFRPDTAHFEAADIRVFSNIIVGSWAAVAYVGAVNVRVENNTIYNPENWVIRILQETVDPDRFLECGDNTFRNNIVHLDRNLSTETNIGPNTRPETFSFSHNLWYNSALPNWSGPDIPTPDPNMLLNQNPLFADAGVDDFHIPPASPAAGAGIGPAGTILDFYGQGYANPPSIGAAEANPVSDTNKPTLQEYGLWVYPNPTKGAARVRFVLPNTERVSLKLYDMQGRLVRQLVNNEKLAPGEHEVELALGRAGIYLLLLDVGGDVAGYQLSILP
ncbi:MAG: right-handed parallel beta-helix repeat-containing protein [Saprospiraceae bacterium]|nr:right-handed parallel beta-helix repeat-containing protein [Saprospiraceae bacterium]